MTALRGRTTLFALLLIVAASGGRRMQAQVDTVGLLPPGYGTLDLNTITMVMQTSVLEIRFVPLDKRVMRLAKPSVDSAMDQLVARFKTQIKDAADRAGVSTPGLAMVTFYATQPGSQFTPQDLQGRHPGPRTRADRDSAVQLQLQLRPAAAPAAGLGALRVRADPSGRDQLRHWLRPDQQPRRVDAGPGNAEPREESRPGSGGPGSDDPRLHPALMA